MTVHKIRSFVYNQSGGNPAGVVLDLDKSLSDVEMLNIAKEVGFSETAFIANGTNGADFDLRFFTPTDEVPLCGHATIASFWHLAKIGMLTKESYIQNTKAGHLAIKVTQREADDFQVVMAQTPPIQVKSKLTFDDDFIAAFPNAKIDANLPIDIWSTGLEDILLPIETPEALNDLKVNFSALSELSKRYDVVGVHAFALKDGKVHARNFAPLYGIDEESATGTSNGALTAYLHHYLYPNDEQLSLCVLQGESMGETSAIFTTSIRDKDDTQIWVGGSCSYMPV